MNNPRWPKGKRNYTVDIYRTGSKVFRAKTKGEAAQLARDWMTAVYGKPKAITAVYETTELPESILTERQRAKAELGHRIVKLEKELMELTGIPGPAYEARWKGPKITSPHIVDLKKRIKALARQDKEYPMGSTPSMKENPGTNWHVDRANVLKSLKRFKWEKELNLDDRIDENELAAEASRGLGMNPKKGQKKCPICKKFCDYQWQAGGWYCPDHKFFFPSDWRNPGAAWHTRSANAYKHLAGTAKGRKADDFLLVASDREDSAKAYPTRKSMILPLALIGGLAWLIYKNRGT